MSSTATVMVATYGRPERLAACLEGLRVQTRRPDEIVVVTHRSDDASACLIGALGREQPEMRHVVVEQHGTIVSMNRCLAEARGEIAAFVDDDAVPHPDWLERIVETYASDSRIAAVGGRDVILIDELNAPRRRWLGPGRNDVGRIQWFGRMLGNHHLGSGAARDVDVLKGANMSFRREEVMAHGFDERLHGKGAVVHTEMSICLPLRRRGLRVIYDPGIVVSHYPSARVYGYGRTELRHEEVAASVHNETLQILDHFRPGRRVAFLLWAVLIGTSAAPGMAVTIRDLLTGRQAPGVRFWAALTGRAAALATLRRQRGVPLVLLASVSRQRDSLATLEYRDGHRSIT